MSIEKIASKIENDAKAVAKENVDAAKKKAWDVVDEANKKAEKGYKTQTDVLRGVAKSLPSLTRAVKVAGKADDGVFEEVSLKRAYEGLRKDVSAINTFDGDSGKMEDIIGEILLKTAILSAILKINPEFALTKSIEKFINRFERYEAGK